MQIYPVVQYQHSVLCVTCKQTKLFLKRNFFVSWFSSSAFGAQASNIANIEIKINEDLGSLELGGIDQEYILDPDLRDVLAKTELDINKTEVFEDQQLRLITSVIYSQRFAVKGNRKNEVF